MKRKMFVAGGVALAVAGATLATIMLTISQPVLAAPAVYTNSATGIAINGYDPVAYFTVGAPVQGLEEFSAEWSDVPWHFSSAENRDLFLADPERYAPQYGGWCSFAMAHDAFAPTVPEAWSVRDDKLYLNFSEGVRSQWVSNFEELLPRAESNWQGKLAEQ